MCPAGGHGDASGRRNVHAPGGASLRQPADIAAVLNPDKCRNEALDFARAVSWHDAASIAKNADPSVLFIKKAPCKVTATPRAMLCFTYSCFVPSCDALLRQTRSMTLPTDVLVVLDDPMPSQSWRATVLGRLYESATHLSGETCERGVCFCRARKPRARERFTHSVKQGARTSETEFRRVRAPSHHRSHARVPPRQITTPIQAVAVMEMSQIDAFRPQCEKSLRHRCF